MMGADRVIMTGLPLSILWYCFCMKKLWFRRKLYGWGWVPTSWEGWVVTIAYVTGLVLIFRDVDSRQHSVSDTLLNFDFWFVILTSILLVICYWKGETPRWQWGRRRDSV